MAAVTLPLASIATSKAFNLSNLSSEGLNVQPKKCTALASVRTTLLTESASLSRCNSEYRSSSQKSTRRNVAVRASSDDQVSSDTSSSSKTSAADSAAGDAVPAGTREREIGDEQFKRVRRQAESTDFIASGLTRRFGLGAGLAWAGFLAFGVISEQIKTRTEVFNEEKNTKDVTGAQEVTLPNGVKYTDLRVGGGTSPLRGDLVLVALSARLASSSSSSGSASAPEAPDAELILAGKDIAFIFGARPLVGAITLGLEDAMKSMRVGGRRRVLVPAALAFGAKGSDIGAERVVPPDADVEYTVELKRASIAPS